MYPIIAYLKYNIKMLSKDKLPMVWSILLPSIFLIINKTNVLYVQDLRFWWSYIIVSSYIYGIGLYALSLRESGCLKTTFSINHNRFSFFFGILLTQVLYSFVCITIFNILVFMIYRFHVMALFLYSNAMILLLIPIGFLGFSITLIKKIHVNSLSTLVNIIFMVLFYLLSFNTEYYYINPLYYFSNVIMIRTILEIIFFLVTSIIMILIGVYSIKQFSAIPTERR